ncbi:hypothetical protein FSP39_019304 [Pinctada imbricata]|uniref:Small subunit processome component 20 homolog n=1 Tax=Pinctada imbricata TaxID=66713 RepID=A0AA88Y5T0_PINIB|nr:hypothetical protein FSP39_019304 [Pinctada imbricata]
MSNRFPNPRSLILPLWTGISMEKLGKDTFQSFSERIANVNIDVIHKIKQYDDTPEESGTHFGEALDQWIELNCTEHFTNFRHEISDQVQSFTQLVHHENEIVKALHKHLRVPQSLAYEPLLDLLVQLARDLQKDFYRHFQDFFELLVELLGKNHQDTELLEKLFSTLSYLFKFLWRYLVNDIKNVYKYFSKLLEQQYQIYIRNFAAESFAFLMRKVKNHGELFDFLFSTLRDAPETAEGMGRLMFEMMKGVSKQFHSCTEKVFPILLSKLGECQAVKKVTKLPWEQVTEAVSHTFQAMAKHTNRDSSSIIWSLLLNFIDQMHKTLIKSPKKEKSKAAVHLSRILKLTSDWLSHRHGYIIADPDNIAKSLLLLVEDKSLPIDTGEVLIETVTSLLVSVQSKISVNVTAKLVSAVFKTEYTVHIMLNFSKSLIDLPIFEKDVIPSLLSYIKTCSHREDPEFRTHVLNHLTDVLMQKAPAPSDGSQLENRESYVLDFGSDDSFPLYVWDKVQSIETKTLDRREAERLWSSLVCLPHIRKKYYRSELKVGLSAYRTSITKALLHYV